MKVIQTALDGAFIIEPKLWGDARGFFAETYHKQRYREVGITLDFVQDNVSSSSRGVLRGLHYQHINAQGKLVYVLQGEVFDVAVDIRKGSPTFGQWAAVILSDKKLNQFWVPPGFAHGFCVLSEQAIFAYKCTNLYRPETEVSLLWNDADIGIEWPLASPTVSTKDEKGLLLKDIPIEKLPVYGQIY
jgi:dTDP-4-dehydrorhamnose 3,5-epimerase